MSPALQYDVNRRVVPREFYANDHDAKLARRTGPSSLARHQSSQKRAIAPYKSPSSTLSPHHLSSVRRSSVKRSSVRKLSTAHATPSWLKLLIITQRSSTTIVALLVAAVLGVYGWTVFSQQLWGQQYQKKVELEKAQRDYSAANEAIKDHSSRVAESPESRLRLPQPTTNLFLPAMPPRPMQSVDEPAPSFSDDLTIEKPIAY